MEKVKRHKIKMQVKLAYFVPGKEIYFPVGLYPKQGYETSISLSDYLSRLLEGTYLPLRPTKSGRPYVTPRTGMLY